MRGLLKFAALFALLTLALTGCDVIKGLFNPFHGKWKAGMFELEFESSRSFRFSVGSTISLNLNGEYSYDDHTLVLKFDGGSEATFSYEFSDDRKKLMLVPETDFEYIKTKLEFEKE
jgi:hypothetical protein